MRGGQVWSQKTPLNGNDPASKAPAPDSPSSDGLDGVEPIENAPAPSPAPGRSKKLGTSVAPSLTPPAVDDVFQQPSQDWLIDFRPDLWEGKIPSLNPTMEMPPLPWKAEPLLGTRMSFRGAKYHPLGAVVLGGFFLLTSLPFQPFQWEVPSSPPRPRLGRPRSYTPHGRF